MKGFLRVALVAAACLGFTVEANAQGPVRNLIFGPPASTCPGGVCTSCPNGQCGTPRTSGALFIPQGPGFTVPQQLPGRVIAVGPGGVLDGKPITIPLTPCYAPGQCPCTATNCTPTQPCTCTATNCTCLKTTPGKVAFHQQSGYTYSTAGGCSAGNHQLFPRLHAAWENRPRVIFR